MCEEKQHTKLHRLATSLRAKDVRDAREASDVSRNRKRALRKSKYCAEIWLLIELRIAFRRFVVGLSDILLHFY